MIEENNKFEYPKKLYSWLWNYSLNYLAQFEVSKKNLEGKLIQRKERCPYEVSEFEYNQAQKAVIEKLLQQDLLSDRRYGDMRLRQLLLRGKSIKFICQDLKKNGLDSSLIDELVKPLDDLPYLADEVAALFYIKKRKFGCFRLKDWDVKQQNKELASLGRQGFSYGLSRKILSLDKDEAEDMIKSFL